MLFSHPLPASIYVEYTINVCTLKTQPDVNRHLSYNEPNCNYNHDCTYRLGCKLDDPKTRDAAIKRIMSDTSLVTRPNATGNSQIRVRVGLRDKG